MKRSPCKKLLLSVLLLCFLIPMRQGSAQTDFYQGKTIKVVRGAGPGGLGELRLRSFLPYLAKYIPGNPTVIIEFMPGAGGRKAANYMYATAPRDGLVIGSIPSGVIAGAILGEPGTFFDVDKLIYLGSTGSGTQFVFLTRKEAGFDSVEKLRAATGVRIGAQSVGHPIYVTGRLFSFIIGLQSPKFVTGYTGPEVDLAVVRGEVDGRSNEAGSLVRVNREWIEKKLMHFHAILEVPRGNHHPLFPQLPELETFVRSDRDRKLLSFFRTLRVTGAPFFLPPGTPEPQVAVLTAAFRKAFQDPEFHKQHEKMTAEEVSAIMPEEQARVIKEIPRDAETLDLYKKIAGADALPSR